MDALNKDCLAWLLRATTTAMAGAYFGGTYYCSIVECKARLALSPPVRMIDHWQEHFPRALTMCQRQCLVTVASGVGAYLLAPAHEQSKFILAAAATMLTLMPYTYGCIMPLNYILLDGDVPKKKDDAWIVSNIKKWESLHNVRTVIGAVAFAISMYSYMRLAK